MRHRLPGRLVGLAASLRSMPTAVNVGSKATSAGANALSNVANRNEWQEPNLESSECFAAFSFEAVVADPVVVLAQRKGLARGSGRFAADLAVGSEVVLVFGQNGDAWHFIGEGGSDFEFAKNHRAKLNGAPRCHGMIVERRPLMNQVSTGCIARKRSSDGC